ncbi:MAG: hypothetical protein ACOYOB_17740 [Myxococcota bacterium]
MTHESQLDPRETTPHGATAATAFANRATVPTMLERLFAMAQRYRKEGNFRQATEMYWTMVSDHAGAPQAEAAKAELLLLAEDYERTGRPHMARGMYQRLMDLGN